MSKPVSEGVHRRKQKSKHICPFRSPPGDQVQQITIAADGDVILYLEDAKAGINGKYRCSSRCLASSSSYFNVLLDPTKFREGKSFKTQSEALEKRAEEDGAEDEDIPIIQIREVGDLACRDGHCASGLEAFLQILHGRVADAWRRDYPHILEIACFIAIIADRFSATAQMRENLNPCQSWHGAKDFETHAGDDEDKIRRKLLIGLLLGDSGLVKQCSARLICQGSKSWRAQAEDADLPLTTQEALWWRLPQNLEEELQCRHQCVLETVSSIPRHFLKLYTSTNRLCKKYYDNSPQCDSFQLGEMTRFFSRKKILDFDTWFPNHTVDLHVTDDAEWMLSQLQQCPDYQIDQFHRHCGIRSDLLKMLPVLSPSGQVGVCLDCWNKDREKESWLENPARGCWVWAENKNLSKSWYRCEDHRRLKVLYTAETWNWSRET